MSFKLHTHTLGYVNDIIDVIQKEYVDGQDTLHDSTTTDGLKE